MPKRSEAPQQLANVRRALRRREEHEQRCAGAPWRQVPGSSSKAAAAGPSRPVPKPKAPERLSQRVPQVTCRPVQPVAPAASPSQPAPPSSPSQPVQPAASQPLQPVTPAASLSQPVQPVASQPVQPVTPAASLSQPVPRGSAARQGWPSVEVAAEVREQALARVAAATRAAEQAADQVLRARVAGALQALLREALENVSEL